jgi:hypothetical protein
MNEDRLNEIEKLAQIGASGGYDVVDLVAEVRRLRGGITELADETAANDCSCGGCGACSNEFHLLPRLRALLGEDA